MTKRKSKKKTLVTGATGFLGTHLLERLADEPVRVLARDASDIESDGIEVVEGSILDGEAVRAAVDGVDRIYHLAGKVSRNPEDTRELYRVHVDGTKLLCAEASRAGVSRIVLASTSGTIAVTSSGHTLPDESYPTPLELIGQWPYYTSKLYQEQAATRGCAGGPDLVILNPSLLLGPGDARLSSTDDVLRLLTGEIPVVPPGGVNFVDVRDAADAFKSAMDRGEPGARYLLGGPNWTFEMFFEKVCRAGGVKMPRLRLPEFLYLTAGRAVDAFYRHWDKAPPVDRMSLEMGKCFWYVDAGKAERELGFSSRNPYETLNETVSYLQRSFLGEAVFD